MKLSTKLFAVLFLFILVSLTFLPISHVSALAETPPPIDIGRILAMFEEAKLILAGMLGLSGLIAICINLAKTKGWIKDDSADVVFQVCNIVALVLITLVKLFAPDFDLGLVDELAASLVAAFPAMLGIGAVLDRIFGHYIHVALRGVPAIGKSNSYDEGDPPTQIIVG